MANSLEFSPGGHPIENRFDGYGELIDSEQPEDRAAIYRAQDRITKIIDEKRAAFLASGQPDDFDPFAPVEGEDDEVTK